MDSAPDSKRPRLSSINNSWSAGSPHHPVSLPTPLPHHPPSTYQPFPPRSEAPPPLPPPAPPSLPLHIDDRRHHDQEPYTPMQDHYRPPVSPAHPSPYHPYPPRDPGIKREPDESMAQPRRPHSTGNQDGGLPPHQGGHHMSAAPQPPPPPPPQAYGEDPRRHRSFDNSPHMPPTPGQYRAPSYPSTPIVPPPPHYEHSPYSVPPTPQDSGLYNIQYSTTAKRKATRASQVGVHIGVGAQRDGLAYMT